MRSDSYPTKRVMSIWKSRFKMLPSEPGTSKVQAVERLELWNDWNFTVLDGLLYYHAVKAAIERGSFKIIQIRGLEIAGRTYIVYNKERPLSPNAEEFLKLLQDWRDNQTAKRPKPSPNTHVGARINLATCWAFAASALL